MAPRWGQFDLKINGSRWIFSEEFTQVGIATMKDEQDPDQLMCFAMAKTFTPTDATFENGSSQMQNKVKDNACGLDLCTNIPEGNPEADEWNDLKECQCECVGPFCKQMGLDRKDADPCADDVKANICPTFTYDDNLSKDKFDITCPADVDCEYVYGEFATACDAGTNTCTLAIIPEKPKKEEWSDKDHPNRKEGQEVFDNDDRKENYDKKRHTFEDYDAEEDPHREGLDDAELFFYDMGKGIELFFVSMWDLIFP